MSSRVTFSFQLQLVLSLPLVAYVSASYCGQAAIPMALEVLSNGQPVLGCARPTCFGWAADGRRSADAALFYKIGNMMDGYLRASDRAGPAVKNASLFQPQFSVCERGYISDRCISPQQWVGGIAPVPHIDSGEGMKIMCCTYERLRYSSDKGALQIRAGQSVQGGEMRNAEGRQQSFEYISNIERTFDAQGVLYTIHMRSFKCVPEPSGPTEVEEKARQMLIDNIDAVTSTTTRAPKLSRTPPPPVPAANTQAKFDEQTFELPEEMPAEDLPAGSKRSQSTGIPFAVPYEVESAQTLNGIPRQPNAKNSGADSDVQPFRARARAAPTLSAGLIERIGSSRVAVASAAAAAPLPQSHSPYYSQQQAAALPANPLDPLGIFGGGMPFGWSYPTSPSPPAAKLPPLQAATPVELPTVEEVEKAIPEAGKQIIGGVSRVLRALSQ